MNSRVLLHRGVVPIMALLSACASLQQLITAPDISLRNVQVESLELNRQTFLLAFDISNPNSLPLPIDSIRYALELEGHRFASGETQGGFTVPAGGDAEFSVSVDLNLWQTAPELLLIVRNAARRDISYRLVGELGVDIPYAKPVKFSSDGTIRL